jgi:hypothetical protein
VQRRVGGGRWGDVGVGAGAGAAAVILIIGGVFVSRHTRIVEARPVQPHDDSGDEAVHSAGVNDDTSVQASGLDGLADPGVSPDDAAAVASSGLNAEAGVQRLPRLRVRLIGPLEVEGTLASIRRVGVLRVLLVLCLNLGRPISSGELRNRLATSDDSEPSAPTVRSELSRLRKVLPDALLPDREPGSGYGLPAEDVEVDWFVFRTLMAQAGGIEDALQLESAAKALRLVRGPVLEHRSWHGIDPLVWEMTAEIERFASQAAEQALRLGQPTAAGDMARWGLMGAPGSPGLWRLRIRAAASGSGENLDQLKQRAKDDIGEEIDVDATGYEARQAPA